MVRIDLFLVILYKVTPSKAYCLFDTKSFCQLILPSTIISSASVTSYYILYVYYTEVLDYGYPQKTDTGILKTYITQTGIKTQVSSECVCVYMCARTCVYVSDIVHALCLDA